MIKKIIACLTICLIVIGLISPVFSHAEPIPIYTPNWDNPGIAEIINISDLTGWMANGGVYDITSFQNLDEFLSLYFKIRVPVQDEDGNISFSPYYGYDNYLEPYYNNRFIEQSNIRGMIGRSYRNKTGYGRRLQEQVDKALIEDSDLTNVLIPMMDLSEAAFFVGYNTNAISYYTKSFLSDNVQPDPDPDYVSYINSINGEWLNYTLNIPTSSYYDWRNRLDYSYVLSSAFGDFTPSPGGNNSVWAAFNLSNVYIYTNPNGASISFDFDNKVYPWYSSTSATSPLGFNGMRININSNAQTVTWQLPGSVSGNRYGQTNPFETSINFQSLENAFIFLSNNVKNVNIYVDSVLWALAGEIISDDYIPEFPEVVGGDELPVTTWPLTVPKAPSYINIPGLRQAFQRAKNTDNKFDIMDLVDSLVDSEGDPILDPEMETVPIPLPNPDPINPEVIPELPDLPLIPPANNPGFSGVSVLAEIINFTNQSLPSGLITVFWGIVFGAVILGIIKILHK